MQGQWENQSNQDDHLIIFSCIICPQVNLFSYDAMAILLAIIKEYCTLYSETVYAICIYSWTPISISIIALLCRSHQFLSSWWTDFLPVVEQLNCEFNLQSRETCINALPLDYHLKYLSIHTHNHLHTCTHAYTHWRAQIYTHKNMLTYGSCLNAIYKLWPSRRF